MQQQVEILGAHLYAFRDGSAFTVPEAGTASRTSKPGPTDPAWIDQGIVDVIVQPQQEELEVWAPSPGVKQLEDVIPNKRQLNLQIKKTELDNMTLELLWGAEELPNSPTAGGQFNPMEMGANGSKWWLKLQYYGRAGTNLITVDLYCFVKYDGDFAPGEAAVETQLLARTLRSTLNTGTLA